MLKVSSGSPITGCFALNDSALIKSGWMVCSLDWPALMQSSCNEFYKVSHILSALQKYSNVTAIFDHSVNMSNNWVPLCFWSTASWALIRRWLYLGEIRRDHLAFTDDAKALASSLVAHLVKETKLVLNSPHCSHFLCLISSPSLTSHFILQERPPGAKHHMAKQAQMYFFKPFHQN